MFLKRRLNGSVFGPTMRRHRRQLQKQKDANITFIFIDHKEFLSGVICVRWLTITAKTIEHIEVFTGAPTRRIITLYITLLLLSTNGSLNSCILRNGRGIFIDKNMKQLVNWGVLIM